MAAPLSIAAECRLAYGLRRDCHHASITFRHATPAWAAMRWECCHCAIPHGIAVLSVRGRLERVMNLSEEGLSYSNEKTQTVSH